jgi:hypothetical protein
VHLIYAIDPTLGPVFVVAPRHPRQPHRRSVRELVQEFRRLSMFSADAKALSSDVCVCHIASFRGNAGCRSLSGPKRT